MFMKLSGQEPLITPTSREIFYNSAKKTAIQFGVAAAFTVAFARTLIEIAEENPAAGSMLAIVAIPCIFEAARVFYGEHVAELLNVSEELKHIASHLDMTEVQIDNLQPWLIGKTLLMMMFAVALTFSLGLTKIALTMDASWGVIAAEMLYLFIYSLIDAAPHVAHLRLRQAAWNKFSTLSFGEMFVVAVFVLAHAATDSADLWNAPNLFWRLWSAIGMVAEGYLSHVEAIAHHHPHTPAFTAKTLAQLSLVFVAALSIAFCNYYNTYKLSKPTAEWQQILFFMAQSINVFFFTFEVWNHYPAAHQAHDYGAVPESIEEKQSDNFRNNAQTLYCSLVGTPVVPGSHCSRLNCNVMH